MDNKFSLNGYSNHDVFLEFSRKIIEFYRPSCIAIVTDINPSILQPLCDKFNEFSINVYVMEEYDDEYIDAHQLPTTLVIDLKVEDHEPPSHYEDEFSEVSYTLSNSIGIGNISIDGITDTSIICMARMQIPLDITEFINYKPKTLNNAILHQKRKGITVYQKSKI